MKQKIKITDKNLYKNCESVIGLLGSVASLVGLAIALPKWYKLFAVIPLIIFLSFIFYKCWRANKLDHLNLKLGNTNICIKQGDLLQKEKDSINIINFNDFLDVVVDEKIIISNSLHGGYINKFWKNKSNELNNILQEEAKNKFEKIEEVCRNGNKIRYKIGGVIEIDGFGITPFSIFDNDNKAILTYTDFINFWFSFWENIDQIYANRTINIGLFGSGITRFKNGKVPNENLLEIMLLIFSLSSFQGKRVNILLDKNTLDNTDLFHLKVPNK